MPQRSEAALSAGDIAEQYYEGVLNVLYLQCVLRYPSVGKHAKAGHTGYAALLAWQHLSSVIKIHSFQKLKCLMDDGACIAHGLCHFCFIT